MDHPARVRFAPSPTGYLHVGGARTALFNWLIARRSGGAFVLRIEDTDQARNVDDSVKKILADMRWLGLTWDEGPEAGGANEPYYQSRRLPLYQEHLQRLLAAGDAYYGLESPEELSALREAANTQKRTYKYRRPNPVPTIAEGEAARAAGRSVVVRFRMPERDITVADDILGHVTIAADQHEDFVLQKSDGFPTYHFACVVDDALMGITHVLRGQEHLMNTPKHVALQRALGFPTPRYAHLPVIANMDGSKMSKRDKEKALAKGQRPPEIEVHDFRAAGYLPEALINFIALLGWSAGDDREVYTLEELVQAFAIERVGKTNARFDREKLAAFNTAWVARVSPARLLAAFKDYLGVQTESAEAGEGAMGAPWAGRATVALSESDERLAAVLQACAGFRTFEDVMKKAGFLWVADDQIAYDPKAVHKVLTKKEGEGLRTLERLVPALAEQADWSAAGLEALVGRVCQERGVTMGDVAQPLRVAVSGGTISPAIVETLLLLGRESVVARVRRCLSLAAAQ